VEVDPFISGKQSSWPFSVLITTDFRLFDGGLAAPVLLDDSFELPDFLG
jgi:hypothetical protein